MTIVSPRVRRLVLAVVWFVFAGAACAAELHWNFGTSGDGPVAAPAGLPVDVTGGEVSRGNNNGTTDLLTTVSASGGYGGASGSYNAGAAARTGALNLAAGGSAYFEFTLTPAAGRSLTLSNLQFGSRSTSTGPQAFVLRTSLDGFGSDVTAGALSNNSTWALQTPGMGTLTAPVGAAVTLRLYGYGGTGTPGAGTANWRIDDLRLTVTTSGDTPVAPAVIATNPAADAVDVPVDGTISVTFNQPVVVTDTWFNVTSAIAGPLSATASGGPTSFTLTPATAWSFDDIITVTILASQVAAADNPTLHPAADTTWSFVTEPEPPAPGGESTLYWNFGTAATGGVATPEGLPMDLADGAVTQGNNNGSTAPLTTTSASGGYPGASGSFNAGAAARTGVLNTAPNGSAYFEFTLVPDIARQVVLTGIRFGSRSTGTGPQAYTILTSADGFGSPVASGTLLNNSTWASLAPTLASPVIAPSSTPLTVRIYGHNGAGSPAAGTANWRIDDLTVVVETTEGDPIAPRVVATTPADGGFDVEPGASITLTFNQPVLVAEPWFAINGSASGTIAVSVSGGPATYMLTPLAPLAFDETVTVTVFASGVTEAATETLHPETDQTFTFSTVEPAGKIIPISIVQGAGDVSPRLGRRTSIRGVVVGDFQGASPNLGGFFVQSLDAETDADPATSEGVFVFDQDSGASIDVAVGDLVTVTGTVTEYLGLTEINAVSLVVKAGTAPLPEPAVVALPVAAASDLERYEGTRVRFTQELTVTGNRSLGQYGELVLSAEGRLLTPTNVLDVNDHPPSGTTSEGVFNKAAVDAYQVSNDLRRIVLDDGSTATYPSPTPFLGPVQTRRVGDTITGLTGILSYGFGTYRVFASEDVAFTDTNPRQSTPPSVGELASLRVASFNVLNYFTTFGGSNDRGANNATEFARQKAKIVAALQALDADIVGLIELQNRADVAGVTNETAINDLVAALNAALPAGDAYAAVPPPAAGTGTDYIRVGFIYRPARVTPVGVSFTDTHSIFSRPPLAQLFELAANGERLVVCLNHFKSKGSGTDDGTGQGLDNARRKAQATRLISFLDHVVASVGDPDVLIIGDLNAYAEEDPIDILRSAGYVDQIARFNPGSGYSYNFDEQSGYLDHALASPSLSAQTTGAVEWHINSDEPAYFDYNLENKTAEQQAINTATPFRSSDHDPVLVGLWLMSGATPAGPVIVTPPASQNVTVGSSVTFTVVATGQPALMYQWRKDGQTIDGATAPEFTIASPVVADGGSYDVVVSNPFGAVTSAPAVLTIQPAIATITLHPLAQTYTGAPRIVSATTQPAGLNVTLTYDGGAVPPANAGAYLVRAEIADPNYVGSAEDTLVVAKATATVTLGSLQATYDGSPKAATAATDPAGLPVELSYAGSSDAPITVGSYAVEAIVVDSNYTGAAFGTLVIRPVAASLSLSNLLQPYDGTPRPVSVTTDPAGLNVVVTYNGQPQAPITPGAYQIDARVDDSNYTGTASDTLVITITALVRHAPSLSGGVDGSIQILRPESVTLNSSAWVAGDLLVPGTPAVTVHKGATYGGTLNGDGAAAPSNHQVALGSSSVLRHVVRRTDAIALPVVAAPTPPAGTRDVTLSSSSQSTGDFATLRNLTLNANVGRITVPPGRYGAFTANRNSGFTLGIAGATEPAVYELQSLTLNSGAEVRIVGPVVLTLATGTSLSGSVGTMSPADWLTLNLASGGLTLNTGVTFRGHVVAPSGTVTINRNATLTGTVAGDRLSINGGVLQEQEP
jgi:uncharacterized protein